MEYRSQNTYPMIQEFLDNAIGMYVPSYSFRDARKGCGTTGYGHLCAFHSVYHVPTIGNHIFVYG